MLDFIARLSPREQSIFGLSALVLLSLLVHATIIEPYLERQTNLIEQRDQELIDLKWMESVVNRLPSSQVAGGVTKFEGSLANLIDKEVKSHKLDSKLAQMTPVGRDEIRVRFTGIAFARLLDFIARINSQGLSIKDLRVIASENLTEVDASLVLELNG
jgi:type II secretory pathway component PulM